MDLYSLLSLEAFLLIPVVIYFLFFKKRDQNGKDLLYFVKSYFAKKIVKNAQLRSKRNREALLKRGVDPAITFSSEWDTYFQEFKACDQHGNNLSLKFTLKSNKTAEVLLLLRLDNGSAYCFPGHKTYLSCIKENEWKVNGLAIENLEPYKKVRIIFNGLLQNVTTDKIEHVQFNFIFNCCSAPQFYPENCDTNLLTRTLATRPWKDASWKNFLCDQSDGYEQFGALLGFVKGDSISEEKILNLPSCRTVGKIPEEPTQLYSGARIFLAEANGVLISLTIKSFKEQKSELSYGFICHKKFTTIPITKQDLSIERIATLEDLLIIRINCKSDEYTCVLNINKKLSTTIISKGRFQLFQKYSECDVNVSRGKALLDYFIYDKFVQPHIPKLKELLSETRVENLPDDIVVALDNDKCKILELTGGKGTSLALLKSIETDEFIVPGGFVITVNAFRKQIMSNNLLQQAIQNIEEAFRSKSSITPKEACDLAVQYFSDQPMLSQISKEIVQSLRLIKNGKADYLINSTSWAVRSSAIGEDSDDLSSAGQNETILGCTTEEDILKAVSKCWASLYSYQSTQYRWHHGVPVRTDMAVVVQKMVPSEAAGVLFTWHPSSSNPSKMVITSNFGLGETVVSGKSEPDTYILNRSYDGRINLSDKTIGSKQMIMKLTDNGVEETSEVNSSNAEVTGRWSLNNEQVLKLGRVGVQLEEVFGEPRDIEWAFYQDKLYLLQSRPITTMNAWTDFELAHEFDSAVTTENSLYTVANTGEVFPQSISALSRTTVLPNVDLGTQQCITGEINPYFLKNVCSFHHRVMLDCVVSIYSSSRTEDIQTSTKVLDLAVYGHPVMNEKINRMVISRLGPQSPFDVMTNTYRRWRDSTKIVEIVKESTEYVKSIDFGIHEKDDALTIFQKMTEKQDSLFKSSFYHSYASSASIFWQMICMMILVGKEKELTTTHFADFANILSTCEDVESAEVPLYLEKIAKAICNEGYSEEFCNLKAEKGMKTMKLKCPQAYKVFEEFLDRHGHRCLGEFDLMKRTWGIDPSEVIPMIQANIKNMGNSVKDHKTIDQVVDNLSSPINAVARKILKYTLSKLRVAVGKREQSKSAFIFAINKTRLAYTKLAQEMVKEGMLPSEDLIYHLTKYELAQVVKGHKTQFIHKAMRRQKLYEKWNKLKFPELSYGFPQPEPEIQVPIELVPGSKCLGTPVCVGSVQARACVITSLDEIGALQKGDILITYSTDIGWSPYFPILSGIVTELGGLISHGAVVAREYGIPCIVGVKNVTKLFKTGDIVHLSGKTGELGRI